jgi:hypothetical protein
VNSVAKHVEITKDQAESLKSGKPMARGKRRRSERQHDHELEGKLEKRVAEHKRVKQEPETDSKVGAGALRGVASETIARVYEEIWPGMNVHRNGDPNIEMQEEAYILVLTMIVGNGEDTPRKGLKIREAEISGDARFCQEHAA